MFLTHAGVSQRELVNNKNWMWLTTSLCPKKIKNRGDFQGEFKNHQLRGKTVFESCSTVWGNVQSAIALNWESGSKSPDGGLDVEI